MFIKRIVAHTFGFFGNDPNADITVPFVPVAFGCTNPTAAAAAAAAAFAALAACIAVAVAAAVDAAFDAVDAAVPPITTKPAPGAG